MRGKSSGRSLSAVNVIVELEFMMVRRCCSELAFQLRPERILNPDVVW